MRDCNDVNARLPGLLLAELEVASRQVPGELVEEDDLDQRQ